MKIRSNGVIKLSFNGKSRSTSLFTYNLQKETEGQLEAKLREKIVDYFSFYADIKNKTPMKNFEAYSADFMCTNSCKLDLMSTKVSVVGLVYSATVVNKILKEEADKFGLEVDVIKS